MSLWFLIALAVLEFGASITFACEGRIAMAIMFGAYSIAALATVWV